MGVARTWVFPIIRILIFVAIAAALVKLAFFGGLTQGSDRAVPTGTVSDPTVTAEKRTIRNDVKLDATIVADAAVPVRATAAGEVLKVLVATGQGVAGNTPIATVRQITVRADGTPSVKTVTLVAGAGGTVSDLALLPTQQIGVGDTLAQIAPPTFSVVGTIQPAQQYRLLNRPSTAQVTVVGGPQPFECTGLTITTPLAGAGGAGAGAPAASDPGPATAPAATTTVRCAVPAGVTVFSGLAAKVAVPGGSAEGALALPVTAVEGTPGGAGTVYAPAATSGGDPAAKKVTLGVSDGKWVQVTGGLTAADQVLQYVPGAADQQAADAQQAGFGG
ncbi:MAG: hypothetical protein HY996_00730 [Micrococcales bacterium]|nr:hypothetical protein [Micrococcales bacterium]